MRYEVEQKYRTLSHDDLRIRLSSQGAKSLGTVQQRDAYYAHPQRDFAQTDEALRIRRVENEACLTYKGPKADASTKTREEVEVDLAGGAEGANQLDAILLALGFCHVGVVCKSRECFSIEFQGSTVEVALDEVEGLGRFAELELLATTQTEINEAQRIIALLAEELGLSEVERRTYLELLLRR